MAEIGAQLREARTRARIEIAQMEAQTKIRAKYLRALENEEWELLPGPTYVKSFLRTYGDMLGIDGRGLVTEYKNALEPFQAEGELGQMSKHTGGRMSRRQPAGPRFGAVLVIGVLIVAAVGGGAYALTRGGDEAPAGTTPSTQESAGDAGSGDEGSGDDAAAPEASQPRAVSVVAEATRSGVNVCIRAGRRIEVEATELRAGEKTKAVRGRTVLVTADARDFRLMVGGERVALPNGTGPITVSVSEGGVRRTSASTTACRV